MVWFGLVWFSMTYLKLFLSRRKNKILSSAKLLWLCYGQSLGVPWKRKAKGPGAMYHITEWDLTKCKMNDIILLNNFKQNHFYFVFSMRISVSRDP